MKVRESEGPCLYLKHHYSYDDDDDDDDNTESKINEM